MATWTAFLGMFLDLGVEAWVSFAHEHAVFLVLVVMTVIGVPHRAASSRPRVAVRARRKRSRSAVHA